MNAAAEVHAEIVRVEIIENVLPEMLLRSRPAPPVTVRPHAAAPLATNRIPMTTLPINVVTLLSPNTKFPPPVVFWKKFGDQP